MQRNVGTLYDGFVILSKRAGGVRSSVKAIVCRTVAYPTPTPTVQTSPALSALPLDFKEYLSASRPSLKCGTLAACLGCCLPYLTGERYDV